jgi:Zn finger protein HypA/HybF involved in hydrogenase expression
MHELSIIESILEVAEEKAHEAHSPAIRVIKLRLGEFTAISREAIEFAFQVARLGTLASSAVAASRNAHFREVLDAGGNSASGISESKCCDLNHACL